MARKGESIFKRKDGRYEARYIKGYKYNKAIYGFVYARTYNECKKKRTEILLNLRDIEKSKKTTKNKETLNSLIDKWLEGKKGRIKSSSYSRYLQLIETHIRKDIGKINKNKISTELINNYLKEKLENGKLNGKGGLSKNTVYDISLILKQVFKENDLNIKMMVVSKTIGKGKNLYTHDKEKLEKYLCNLTSNDSIGIMLSLLLGLRESEVCGLKWEDIDIENKVINIRRIISRVKSFDTKNKTETIITIPKTKNSIRELPIPNKLINVLKEAKEKVNGNFYLLTGKQKFMDTRTYYNHYKKILKKLNLDGYTYHDLRHTFATNCVGLGIDAKTLMELLGHANINTTLSIYVHSSIEKKRNYINKL